ncbi:MAG: YceD family protein [Pyrinomonadaceae bacterium]
MNRKFILFVMIIDLINLKDATAAFDFLIEPDAVDLEAENVKLKNPVRVTGKVSRGIAQTNVAGKIFAEAEIECARCLQATEQNLEIPFKAAFVTPENYTQAKEAEIGTEDLDVSIFKGDKIDLNELVREQILLNLPEQIFCRADCRGLCEKCGANRNLINCNCIEKEVDPRWSALKNLK